jgi:hypothetical protein
MLRKLIIAASLLAASGSALAYDDFRHGRVISVEPSFSISFGSRHHDGYRILYESGGQRYWHHSHSYPRHTYIVPSHSVHYGYGHYQHGWKHHRDDDRYERRHDRRHDRHERRHHRHHDDD